ncbi:MAG TPA: hypothetical protein VK929_12090 [Longimicrobiales bacterium]|nr:hypothetical protein [Longimicrobiales bacterium]
MTFIRSVIVLAAVCLCIAFAYFFGHALAMHSTTPMIYGAGLLVAGAAIMWFLNRRDRERHPHRLDRQGWV